MGKDKAPADLTLKRVLGTRPYDQDRERVEHGDAAVVRIELWGGPSLALVDTIFSRDDIATKLWFRHMESLVRDHRLRAPLVAGLVSVGGSHAILYQPVVGKDAGGVLAFEDKMHEVREFLGDGRVTVACLGAAEVTRKLAGEWGLHVARPAELTDLFARAHGNIDKIAGVEPWKIPSRVDSQDGEPHKTRLLPKAIEGVGIEHMRMWLSARRCASRPCRRAWAPRTGAAATSPAKTGFTRRATPTPPSTSPPTASPSSAPTSGDPLRLFHRP